MANIRLLLALLVFQICANAAPSDPTKLEEIAIVEQADVKLDSEPNTVKEHKLGSNATEQGQRQKRFYDYYGNGFPPPAPVLGYPSNVKRDDSPYTGNYGLDDPFTQIYRRLQDIAGTTRNQFYNPLPPQPPPLNFPIYLPVFYIPPSGCECNCPGNQPKPTKPIKPVNPTMPMNPSDGNGTGVDIENRFPDMEDDRQNWGIRINESETDDGLGDDFTRPISFAPIPPMRPFGRPPPEVEHGSNQAGENGRSPDATTTTTTSRPPTMNPPSSVSENAPSACDGAILSCCHQPQITYDCFAGMGCPDPSSYGNPCDTQVILRVIDSFQRFYGQRGG